MALPTTIVSDVGLGGHHPPFVSSGKDAYTIVRADADELDAYKATDPTDSWAVQGTGPVHAGTILGYSCVQDSDVIHIVAWSSATYEYYTFNMATDAWVEDQLIETPANAPDQPWASIARRSSPAATIIAYAGDTDTITQEKERVDYAIRETGTGTWDTVGAALDAAGDVHYGNPNCILGTNDQIHFMWQLTTVTTNDPPISWVSSEGRTIDSADDSLSTTDANSGDTLGALLGLPNVLTYDASGTQRMIANGHKDNDLQSIRGTEDGSDDLLLESTVRTEVIVAEGYINGEVGVSTFAALDADMHGLYSGGGTVGVDQDLYYITSTDNGLNWDTETEEIDAITVNFIAGDIHIRGVNTVFAYLYDDAGVQKYNEKILIVGGPVITDVDTDETWDDGDTGLVITGTGFV